MTITETSIGIFEGVPFPDYYALPAINASRLSHIKRSPAHFRAACERDEKQTAALAFGKAFHTLVLEGDKFNDEVLLCDGPKTRQAKAYETMVEENPGKTILLRAEWDDVFEMAGTLMKHDTVSLALLNTKREVTHQWKCRETGEMCKGRIDAWSPTHKTVIDIKTCTNAQFWAFSDACDERGYFNQAAWYSWGMYELGETVEDYILIAIEKEKPYGVKLYRLNEHDLRLAEMENAELLKKYATCKSLDVWPCYDSADEDLRIKEWKRKTLEENYGERIRQTGKKSDGSTGTGENGELRADF